MCYVITSVVSEDQPDIIWRQNSECVFGAIKRRGDNGGTEWIQGTDSEVTVATSAKVAMVKVESGIT